MENATAIIVAAGSSRRMGFDKLAADLEGMPVVERSIRVLQDCPVIAGIVVVTSPDLFDSIRAIDAPKLRKVVEGGPERYLSVWNGIEAAAIDGESLLAVHDAARPLVDPADITRCAEVAAETGAASLAHRVVDTLKRSRPGETTAAESVSRDDLWGMETPQIFRREILVSSYEQIMERKELITDEVSAVQLAGHEVEFVESRSPNLKITVPADLDLARALLRFGE